MSRVAPVLISARAHTHHTCNYQRIGKTLTYPLVTLHPDDDISLVYVFLQNRKQLVYERE